MPGGHPMPGMPAMPGGMPAMPGMPGAPAGGPIEIDLKDLGLICASADNAKDYTFYLLYDRPEYTPQSIQQNPGCIKPADTLFMSSPIPDKEGMAEVDLSTQEKAICDKFNGETKGKIACLATSKTGNKDPNKKLAVLENCTYIAPKLKLQAFGYRSK
jgi:hypothetical protein